MFVREDKFLFRRWVVGAVITFLLVFFGIFWFDAPIHSTLILSPTWFGAAGELFGFDFWLPFAVVFFAIVWVKFNGWKVPTISRICEFFNISRITGSLPVLVVLPSVIIAACLTSPLKYLIGRMRPVFFDGLGQTGFSPMNSDWAFNSMPSGHAAASFAALVALGLCAPKLKPYTWCAAVLIAVSRICVGAHWPSDVIFGAFIGMSAADLAFWAVAKLRKDHSIND